MDPLHGGSHDVATGRVPRDPLMSLSWERAISRHHGHSTTLLQLLGMGVVVPPVVVVVAVVAVEVVGVVVVAAPSGIHHHLHHHLMMCKTYSQGVGVVGIAVGEVRMRSTTTIVTNGISSTN